MHEAVTSSWCAQATASRSAASASAAKTRSAAAASSPGGRSPGLQQQQQSLCSCCTPGITFCRAHQYCSRRDLLIDVLCFSGL
jgi:hypothetical protein